MLRPAKGAASATNTDSWCPHHDVTTTENLHLPHSITTTSRHHKNHHQYHPHRLHQYHNPHHHSPHGHPRHPTKHASITINPHLDPNLVRQRLHVVESSFADVSDLLQLLYLQPLVHVRQLLNGIDRRLIGCVHRGALLLVRLRSKRQRLRRTPKYDERQTNHSAYKVETRMGYW